MALFKCKKVLFSVLFIPAAFSSTFQNQKDSMGGEVGSGHTVCCD